MIQRIWIGEQQTAIFSWVYLWHCRGIYNIVEPAYVREHFKKRTEKYQPQMRNLAFHRSAHYANDVIEVG
jgi:hypothetical protein